MRGTRGESVEPPNRYTVGKLTSMRCEADAGGWLTRTDQVEVHWSGCKDDESGVGECGGHKAPPSPELMQIMHRRRRVTQAWLVDRIRGEIFLSLLHVLGVLQWR